MTPHDLPPAAAPDLALARRFLATRSPPGALVLCAVTGAHQYGFPSPDSDLDLKGVHAAPTRALLGLGTPAESWDTTVVFEGVECDVTTQELARAIGLLLRGNGNMLERLLSPFQVLPGPDQQALADLARASVSRRFLQHYLGFFRGKRREHERAPAAEAKTLLYIYRTALTGAHLLTTGALEADLSVLAPAYGFPEALPLIAHKRAGREHIAVSPEDDALHRAQWPRLEATLLAAHEASPLPEEPPNRDAFDAWLVDHRLRALAARRDRHDS